MSRNSASSVTGQRTIYWAIWHELGMTQHALARQCGVSRGTLTDWLYGRTQPPYDRAVVLHAALHMAPPEPQAVPPVETPTKYARKLAAWAKRTRSEPPVPVEPQPAYARRLARWARQLRQAAHERRAERRMEERSKRHTARPVRQEYERHCMSCGRTAEPPARRCATCGGSVILEAVL